MNPPPRPLGFSSMMQQQRPDPRLRPDMQSPMNLSQNSLAGINQQQYQQRLQGLGSAPFAPPQPARRPGQGQFPASSAAKRRAEPIGFQGASNPFGQRLMPGQAVMDARQTMELQQSLLGETAARQARFAQSPTFAMPRPGEPPRTLQPLPDSIRYGGLRQLGLPDPPPTDPQFLARMRSAQQNPAMTPFGFAQAEQRLGNPNYDVTGRVNPATGQIPRPRADFGAGVAGGVRPPAGITPVQRGASAKTWFPSTQRPEYLPDQEAQQFFPWARGGRVSLKTGGRIPRKKKGAKFI